MDYKSIYDSIIERAKSRGEIDGYTERHHIVPRSLGGRDTKDNIVTLTAREHFICHMCLARFTEGKNRAKMITAARFMCVANNPHQDRYYNSRLYEIAKRDYTENVLRGHEYWVSENTHSDEANRKRSKSMKAYTAKHGANFKGETHTEEARAKMSKAGLGKPKSPEHRAKMAEANRINGLKKRGKSLPKTECCGRLWDPGNLSRHRRGQLKLPCQAFPTKSVD